MILSITSTLVHKLNPGKDILYNSVIGTPMDQLVADIACIVHRVRLFLKHMLLCELASYYVRAKKSWTESLGTRLM